MKNMYTTLLAGSTLIIMCATLPACGFSDEPQDLASDTTLEIDISDDVPSGPDDVGTYSVKDAPGFDDTQDYEGKCMRDQEVVEMSMEEAGD